MSFFQLDVSTEIINITVIDLNDNKPVFEGDYSLIEVIIPILFIIYPAMQLLFIPTTDPEHAGPQSAKRS